MRYYISSLVLAALFLLGLTGCVPASPAAGAPSTPQASPTLAPSPLPPTDAAPAAGTPMVITPVGVVTSGPAVTSQPGGPESTPLSPTLAPPGTAITITRQNTGQTLSMHVGDSFVLSLGEEFDWTVVVADQNVLSRVVNITPLRGSQGVYDAHKTGTTTLTATGDPLCRQSKPACGMPSMIFTLNVNVVP